jgi:soluble lytic murein transglycosylase-like protein
MQIDLRFLPVWNRSTLIQKGSTQTAAIDYSFPELLTAEADGNRVVPAEVVEASLAGGRRDGAFWTTSVNVRQQVPSAAPTDILDMIEKLSQRFGINAKLIEEVVRAESNFNPHATSRAGAKGLMQLMDGTARMLNVTNSYDPEQNLTGGIRYLKSLLDSFHGNIKVALAAYNAGPNRVKRLGILTDEDFDQKQHLLPRETQRYVQKIYNRLYL